MRLLFERLLIAYHFVRQRYFMRFRTRAHLEEWQQRQLQSLIHRLRLNSPFYRDHIREAWQQTPTIDKSTMMNAFDRLNTRGLKREQALELAIQSEQTRDFSPMIGNVTVGLSSGTSGSRGLFCADFFERAAYAGTILAKALPRHSQARKHRVAFFLRANSNLYKTVRSRKLEFEYFDLLKPLSDHVQNLNRYQPTLIVAPPSLLRLLAEQKALGILQCKGVERIFSVAEVLDPIDEKYVAAQFQQKVHQIYQCTEGFLAISCEHGSLHLNEDLLLIEKEWIDREHRKFIPILSDFRRRTQPIFRYRLNDILTENPDPCACGSVMTRLKMIEGRCDDLIYFRGNGQNWQAVFPDFIRNAILYSSPNIEEYLVHQNEAGNLEIALKGPALSDLERGAEEQLSALAKRLNCALPEMSFHHVFPQQSLKKLRRVTSQFHREVSSSDGRLP